MSRPKTKPTKKPKPKRRASAPSRQKHQRETSIKALVKDVKSRVFAEAQQILGTSLWPLSFFEAIPGGVFSLFWMVFDKYRETRQSTEESMWLQMKHLARAQTTGDLNLAVLERLAYDTYGPEKIAELWVELHAVMGVCQGLSGCNRFLTEEEKAEQTNAAEEARRAADEAAKKASQEGDSGDSEIPQEVLDANTRGLETGHYDSRPHPEGATIFGGDGE